MKNKFDLKEEMSQLFKKHYKQQMSEAVKRGIRQAKLNKLAKQNVKWWKEKQAA